MISFIGDEKRLGDDLLSKGVCDFLQSLMWDSPAILYYKFPLYRGDLSRDLIQAPFLLASQRYGVFIIYPIPRDRKLHEDEIGKLIDVYVALNSRFIKHRALRKGLSNCIMPVEIICLGSYDCQENGVTYKTRPGLQSFFSQAGNPVLTDGQFELVISSIEGTTRLLAKKERVVPAGVNTKASALSAIQDQEAVFDLEQKNVALYTIDGPQRIRGLAGSGKTIVLTMKAAQYHLEHPEEEILYTYYTKSLQGMIKTLIERFYRDFSDNNEPDWRKIHILHAWGGSELPGVYSMACLDSGILPTTFIEARMSTTSNPFDYICSNLIKETLIKPKYDLILIDEGQDFPSSFYQVCYRLSKNRRIVWAYDDFQNIFDVKIQDEKETFGKDEDGKYCVDFSRNYHPRQDVVLKKCYRNPRKILISAFSLGLGIYYNTPLQRLQDNQHWEALGFKVESGDSKVGSHMVISRPEENTPAILNQTIGAYSVIVNKFKSMDEECAYVAKQIVSDIVNQKLLPDDICVICLDKRYIGSYYTTISNYLTENKILSFNMLSAANTNTRFSYPNQVTLATINKAKGNECGMVYIIGVDAIFRTPNNILARNMLFTAMTRAKGWIEITGVGNINQCVEELNALKGNDFKLVFKQPAKTNANTVMKSSEKTLAQMNDLMTLRDQLLKSGVSIDQIVDMINKQK